MRHAFAGASVAASSGKYKVFKLPREAALQ